MFSTEILRDKHNSSYEMTMNKQANRPPNAAQQDNM